MKQNQAGLTLRSKTLFRFHAEPGQKGMPSTDPTLTTIMITTTGTLTGRVVGTSAPSRTSFPRKGA